MNKPYKIAYKTYFNSRLKELSFHGVHTYPLYVQVTYNRKTIIFKSSFFELLGQDRYAMKKEKKKIAPTLSFVIEKEKALIEFVIQKYKGNFSLEKFREGYRYYGIDLCQSTEEVFGLSLFLYFMDKQAPSFGKALVEGSKPYVLYDVLIEAKQVLLPSIYEGMSKNLKSSPPYMELYGFMWQFKKWPNKVLTIMEWGDPKVKFAFQEYLQSDKSKKDSLEIIARLEQWLETLRKDILGKGSNTTLQLIAE